MPRSHPGRRSTCDANTACVESGEPAVAIRTEYISTHESPERVITEPRFLSCWKGYPVSLESKENFTQRVRHFTSKYSLRIYCVYGILTAKGVRVLRNLDNLSAEDRRIYRRWVRGLFLFYSAAIVIAVAANFMNRPASDQRASNETQTARLKATTEPPVGSPPAGLARKQ
jgi:hypothetical protein